MKYETQRKINISAIKIMDAYIYIIANIFLSISKNQIKYAW